MLSSCPEASSHLTPHSQNHVSCRHQCNAMLVSYTVQYLYCSSSPGYSSNDSRLFNGRLEGLLDHLNWQWWLILNEDEDEDNDEDEDEVNIIWNANPILFSHELVMDRWHGGHCNVPANIKVTFHSSKWKIGPKWKTDTIFQTFVYLSYKFLWYICSVS